MQRPVGDTYMMFEGRSYWLQLRRKLVVMGGDLGLPGLGLSEEDRQTLTREVHYIVHSAASISFVDHIHNLISHNYVVSSSVLKYAHCHRITGMASMRMRPDRSYST